jgi:hypothetical protein
VPQQEVPKLDLNTHTCSVSTGRAACNDGHRCGTQAYIKQSADGERHLEALTQAKSHQTRDQQLQRSRKEREVFSLDGKRQRAL